MARSLQPLPGAGLVPAPEPLVEVEPPTSLPAYQRALLSWARAHQMPDLDVRAPDAFERARRQLWYSHRTIVLQVLGQGAGLGADEVKNVASELDGLGKDERRRFNVWFLGSGDEATKMSTLQGMGVGRVFGHWKSTKQALAESSVLPRTAAIAFAFAAPPDVETIVNLPQAEAVLDYWQITGRAYVESIVRLRQAQIEDARAGHRSDGDALQGSLAMWRAGGPKEVVSFLAKTASARRHVETGKGALGDLAAADRDDDRASEGKSSVMTASRQAATALAAAQGDLDGLGPQAASFAHGINDTDRKLSRRARQALAKKTPASWWQRAAVTVHGAIGSFAKGLRNPENWKLALELGLEIAGNLATGGLALAARVAKWLVTAGADLGQQVGMVASAIGTLTSKQGLASLLPIGRVFSLARLETLAVDALFGRIQKPTAEPDDAPAKAKPEARKKRGLAAAAGAIGSRIGALYRGARDGVFGLLGKLDMSQETWFSPFVNTYARVVRLGKKASGIAGLVQRARGWIGGVRGRFGDYVEGLKDQVGSILDVLEQPGEMIAAWSKGLVSAGMGFLLRLLIHKPPSAALKIALRLAGSVVNLEPAAIIAWVRQNIPGADTMIGAIEATAAEAIEGAVQEPATQAHKQAAALVASTALPAINGTQAAFDGALVRVQSRVDKLAGTLGAERTEEAPPVKIEQPVESGTTRKKPDHRATPAKSDRSRIRGGGVFGPGKRIQRQPETVLILIQQNAVDFSRRTELIREIGGQGAFQAPEERFLDLGTSSPSLDALRRIEQNWPAGNVKPRTQKMQVLWGSFELFGTPAQLAAFFRAADQVISGNARRGQGPQIVPGERDQRALLNEGMLGRARDVVFNLTGDDHAVRASLFRWLIAARALSHVDNDQGRIRWTELASDFHWQQFPAGRDLNMWNPDRQRANLRRMYPDLFRTLEGQGNLPVLLLCYQFVTYVAMRAGAIEQASVTGIYEDAVDNRESQFLSRTLGSTTAGSYQLLGATGPNHRPLYVRPGSRITSTPTFPGTEGESLSPSGFTKGSQPSVGSAVFVWENQGSDDKVRYKISHVGLCVAPGFMVGLDSGQLQLETWVQVMQRYGGSVEGLSYGPPLV